MNDVAKATSGMNNDGWKKPYSASSEAFENNGI
jgi:hypothetical protein